MADDVKTSGTCKRVPDTVSEDWDFDLKYLSEKFGVNEADIKDAIERVGPLVTDIEAYFNSTLDIRVVTGLPH